MKNSWVAGVCIYTLLMSIYMLFAYFDLFLKLGWIGEAAQTILFFFSPCIASFIAVYFSAKKSNYLIFLYFFIFPFIAANLYFITGILGFPVDFQGYDGAMIFFGIMVLLHSLPILVGFLIGIFLKKFMKSN